jgi:hypothetical protein
MFAHASSVEKIYHNYNSLELPHYFILEFKFTSLKHNSVSKGYTVKKTCQLEGNDSKDYKLVQNCKSRVHLAAAGERCSL